jgi:hypothetical protein
VCEWEAVDGEEGRGQSNEEVTATRLSCDSHRLSFFRREPLGAAPPTLPTILA